MKFSIILLSGDMLVLDVIAAIPFLPNQVVDRPSVLIEVVQERLTSRLGEAMCLEFFH